MQLPLSSQQPAGQLAASQAQSPLTHSWPGGQAGLQVAGGGGLWVPPQPDHSSARQSNPNAAAVRALMSIPPRDWISLARYTNRSTAKCDAWVCCVVARGQNAAA